MSKRDALVEVSVALITLYTVWYQMAPRPSPVPQFWWYTFKTGKAVQTFAYNRYRKSVGY